jgi:tetratricopeptide (TPR) repeat protein
MRLFRSLLAAMLLILIASGCAKKQLKVAQQYELQGNNAKALAIYEKVLEDVPVRTPQVRSEILLRMGECQYRMGRLADAFTSFQSAIEANSQNHIARLRLGEMLLAAGSPERAREQATQVLQRIATNEDALALLGAAWFATDDRVLAKQAYARVLELNPKRVTVAVALADIYNREGDLSKAREILQQASKSQPSSSMPLLALARLEEQQGNGAAAEDYYRRSAAVENTPETNLRLAQFLQRGSRVAEAEQVLRLVDSQRHHFAVALADFQFSAGHLADALERYHAGLLAAEQQSPGSRVWKQLAGAGLDFRENPESQLAPRVLEAEIAAVLAGRSGDETASLQRVRERMENLRPRLDPGTVAVLDVEFALAANNLAQALTLAEVAIATAPDSAAAHYVSGIAQWNSGNKGQALSDWNTALELDTNYVPARLALAEHAIERGDAQAADSFARAIVRDEPGNFHGVILFARALLMQDQPAAAAAMAQRASALDPTSAEPTLLMGEALLRMERIPEALLCFERAVVAHPDSEEAMDGLMKVYRRGAVSYASLRQMERVAQRPPVSAPLLEITGRLYADRGWYREAIRSFNKALKADPKRETAARQLARIQLTTGDLPNADIAAARGGGKPETLFSAFNSQMAGNRDVATAAYERALREGDQSGVAANNLAWIYAEQGTHLDRALQLAQEAARRSPNNPAVLDTLGYVQLRKREYTAAVKTLETAAQLAKAGSSVSDHAVADQIRKHLIEAYFSAGETAAASQIALKRRPFADK